jgi:hypothetical protein
LPQMYKILLIKLKIGEMFCLFTTGSPPFLSKFLDLPLKTCTRQHPMDVLIYSISFMYPVWIVYTNWTFFFLRLQLKSCLFPLFDRPTKIAATQKILLVHLKKKEKIPEMSGSKYFATFFTAFWKYQHQWMYLIIFNVTKHIKM